MTVRDIIGEPADIEHCYKNEEERENLILDTMEMVGLNKDFADRYPHEFSGGQRQRIGIARAIILKPEIIICDEPVSALDVSIQAQILNLMMDLQDSMGLTYMFVTHNLSVIKHISDNIAVMYLGQCVELAPTEELFAHPEHPYTKALLKAIPSLDLKEGERLQSIPGLPPSLIDPPKGCPFAERCEYATERCKNEKPEYTEFTETHRAMCFLNE